MFSCYYITLCSLIYLLYYYVYIFYNELEICLGCSSFMKHPRSIGKQGFFLWNLSAIRGLQKLFIILLQRAHVAVSNTFSKTITACVLLLVFAWGSFWKQGPLSRPGKWP